MKGVMKVVAIPVILALGAAGVGTYLAFRADMRVSRARLLAGSRVVPTARGPIEVAEAGDGPLVLVVHGAGGGFDQGMILARGLKGRPLPGSDGLVVNAWHDAGEGVRNDRYGGVIYSA